MAIFNAYNSGRSMHITTGCVHRAVLEELLVNKEVVPRVGQSWDVNVQRNYSKSKISPKITNREHSECMVHVFRKVCVKYKSNPINDEMKNENGQILVFY